VDVRKGWKEGVLLSETDIGGHGEGGRGQKIPDFCGRLLWMASNFISHSEHILPAIVICYYSANAFSQIMT